MNTIKILGFLLLIGLWSCKTKSKNEELPDEVLPKDSMVQVMIDMNLLEAAFSLNMVQNNLDPAHTDAQYSVVKKNGISYSRYQNSLAFYTAHPTQLNDVYASVIEELSKMESKAK